MTTSLDLFVKTAHNGWDSHMKRFNALLDQLSDEQLSSQVAPGKNSGIYLLGHMVAVHDHMLPLLGFGERFYPDMDKLFLESPDRSGFDFPPISELKARWKQVNDLLSEHYGKLSPEAWMQRHTAVSETDFALEPHRNRMSVFQSRTNHLAYHLGQLILLKS